MKMIFGNISLVLLLAGATIANGATVPPVNVVVSDASGKVSYKGSTGANGTFSTGKLAPGQYVVQFTSKNAAMKGSKYGIAMVAGNYTASADAVTGEKLTDVGVLMRMNVPVQASITGQIAAGGTAPKLATAAKSAKSADSNAKVKVINGKRYIWVQPMKSTLEGGHWEEEGSAAAQQASGLRTATPPPVTTGRMRY